MKNPLTNRNFTKKQEIEWLEQKLLNIITNINVNYPLGAGLAAQVVEYRERLYELKTQK